LLAYQYTSCRPIPIGIPLDRIDLVGMDQIATPNELRLRSGRLSNTTAGANYVIAGSFVRFLIENYGDTSETNDTRMMKFRDVFLAAPLVPLEREPGNPNRWMKAYGSPLADLQQKWKQYLKDHFTQSNCP